MADRIQDEDEEHQIKNILNELLNKKNRNKLKNFRKGNGYNSLFRDISDSTMAKINKILSSKEMKNLNAKKIENLDLNDFSPNKEDNNGFSKISKNNKNFDFLNIYKLDKENLDKENLFKFNVENRLKKCEREINMISRDKALKKRAKEKIYYDRTKDEKNEFNILTKHNLVIEFIEKFRRKLRDFNEINKKNILDNKKSVIEEDDNEENGKKKKKNNNILADNKEKKLINHYINKIKINYKQQ